MLDVLVEGGIISGSRTDAHIFDLQSAVNYSISNSSTPYDTLERYQFAISFHEQSPHHRTVAAERFLRKIEGCQRHAAVSDANPIEQ
ncbi:hypothetical protein TNCV_4181921 [Trichonephila clavipes]|nr:hypothetical protein TNCV_4181921 [Trichonephila clavipes]